MGISSFKTTVDIIIYPPKLFFTPTLNNYIVVLSTDRIIVGLQNSLVITLTSLFIGCLVGIPVAYIFARFNFANKDGLKFFIATLRFMPPVTIIIPFLSIWLGLGLYDTQLSLIVTYLITTSSTMIWLSIECFNAIPVHCEESSAVDGCTDFQTFYKIALPLALPSILGMAVFGFLLIWNEFFIAFVLTAAKSFTMPVAVSSAIMFSQEIPWGQVSAMVILLSIPPLLLTYILLRFLPYYYRMR
jgi:multiple sugar transport system permease protein